jgi:hypothetical protein
MAWLPEQIRFIRQSYDFSCGELHTELEFRPQQVAARVEILVFCSRWLPILVLKEVAVEVDGDCELTLKGAIDPSEIRGSMASRRTVTPGTEEQVVDGLIEWRTRGGLAAVGLLTRPSSTAARVFAKHRGPGPVGTALDLLHIARAARTPLRTSADSQPDAERDAQ